MICFITRAFVASGHVRDSEWLNYFLKPHTITAILDNFKLRLYCVGGMTIFL